MKHVSCWMVTISMSVSIVLMSIFLLCKEPLLILLQVPEETMAGAMEYLTIILIGIPLRWRIIWKQLCFRRLETV